MPKATLWPHIVDLDQVERAAALIARFGGAYGRLFYPLFQLRKCRPTPNLRGPVPKSAHQGEILADRRCGPLRTSLDRYEPRSMGKRVLHGGSSFVRGLVAAADRG